MRLLLDTHTLLWAFAGDPRLSPTAAESIRGPRHELFFSVLGHWEIW